MAHLICNTGLIPKIIKVKSENQLVKSVIAEIGINHDGDIEKAKSLIMLAKTAGCSGIKFQYRNIETAYSTTTNEIGDEIILTQITRTYLDSSAILILRDFARGIGLQAGISFFTTEDLSDFPDLSSDFDFFKIPSAEFMNSELIIRLLKTERSVYISLGMHTEAEIESLFLEIEAFSNWIPLHCISNYPVADHNASLGYITFLKKKWNRTVGYSSHDENWENNIIALALGADVIERHITDSKLSEGLDHSSSSTVDEFEKICSYARNFELITSGNSPRIPNQGELLNKQNLGRSYYAKKDISAEKALNLNDFEYRNPQIGISVSEINQYINTSLVSPISQGSVLTRQHFIRSSTINTHESLEFAKSCMMSIPVRLSDYQNIRSKIPLGAFEFHLSYTEVESGLEGFEFESGDRFSVHLPDYINSTTLIDPFSNDSSIKDGSIKCIEKVISFSDKLARATGHSVPIVASLAGLGMGKPDFYNKVNELFQRYSTPNAFLTLQWLPPYAWYFGGSIKLEIMNNVADLEWINRFKIPVTLDSSHLLLGQNAFGFDPTFIVEEIFENIKHWHISDAQGLDGEGLQLGDGGVENANLISKLLQYNGLKVIEVWQGHFSDYEGFKVAINRVAKMGEATK
jgi:N-acetylneuraminate synthase